jgi:hypothetical protein
MRKLVLLFVSLLTFSMACKKTEAISISGRINCPSRKLTTLTPSEYTIFLRDSAIPTAGRQIQPTADCRYVFDNLESGHTYFVNVIRTVPASSVSLSATAIETYLKTIPAPPKTALGLFAADVNKNGFVNDEDVMILKDFISGKTKSLTFGFWSFLPRGLLNDQNNFTFDNVLSTRNITKSVTNLDFIQVQIGDIDLIKCD